MRPTVDEMRQRTYEPGTWGAEVFGDPPADWFRELPVAQQVAIEHSLINKLPESVITKDPYSP